VLLYSPGQSTLEKLNVLHDSRQLFHQWGIMREGDVGGVWAGNSGGVFTEEWIVQTGR